MKHFVQSALTPSLLGLLLITALPLSASAAGSSLQTVACPDRGIAHVDLYNSKASPAGLKLAAYEQVALFQGWGKNEITKGHGRHALRFVRIQVPAQPKLADQTLYIHEGAVASTSQCESRRGDKAPAVAAPAPAPAPATAVSSPINLLEKIPMKPATGTPVTNAASDEGDDESANSPDTPVQAAVDSMNGIGGLSNLSCCGYPLAIRPKSFVHASFMSGIGSFGASRRGGRTHGGADLYGKAGQAVLAVSPGTVIRAPYFFKARTLAIDVRHQGGFIARYGEISGQSFGLGLNTVVKKGQQLGAMKYVPGAKSPMLHFELYKGNLSGKLSTSGNQYSRRGDITNPTPYLLRWGK